jgi:hypothetical protein
MQTGIIASSTNIKSPKTYPSFSLHHLLFLVYVLANFLIVSGVYTDQFPLHTLSIIPSITSGLYIYHQNNNIQQQSPLSTSPPLSQICPLLTNQPNTATELNTNTEKLCYLNTWQSSNAATTRFLCFSSDHPVCIDTGASCCISNNKSDFTHFKESTSSVLHGISSGLSIHGTGTIKWSINDDNGDKIILYLRKFQKHQCAS